MSAEIVSAAVLGLAWFAIVNVAASAIAWAAAAALAASRHQAGSGVLLVVRLFPAAASVLFVSALFLPSHWRYEPAGARESFGVILYILAAAALVMLGRSAGRALAVARAGSGLRIVDRLTPIDSAACGAGVYEVAGFSGMSLAGVLRTRILVAPEVRDVLTPVELEVALAHEHAHRGALDNVKRFVMLCAPDLFGASSAAQRIEARWRAAAESLADARAVGGDRRRAVHLASALIKVARLDEPARPAQASPAWSTLHDPPLLELRVRRLLEGAAPVAANPVGCRTLAAGGLLAVGLAVSIGASAPVLHQLTEALVRLVP